MWARLRMGGIQRVGRRQHDWRQRWAGFANERCGD